MALSDAESRTLGFLYSVLKDDMAISFSGGKDSLVALDLAYRAGLRKAVFCDTSIEYDETIDYVEKVGRFYDIEIDIVKPPQGFFSMIELVTAPSKRQRWCCEVLKFGPLGSWAKRNRITGFVTGLRSDESTARGNYSKIDKNPLLPITQINPLLEWSADLIWEYIDTYNLPINPMYDHFSRVGCWCCPFKTQSEWRKLEELYPEKTQYLDMKIEQLADKLHIKDKETFVEQRGWTYWIYPTKKVNIGISTICKGEKDSAVILTTDNRDLLERVTDILPIITKDFRVIGNKIRIKTENKYNKKLQILIERAVNCVGCGACTIYCEEGALSMQNNHLVVDIETCTECKACLATNLIKGSCISRHYRPRRSSFVQVQV